MSGPARPSFQALRQLVKLLNARSGAWRQAQSNTLLGGSRRYSLFRDEGFTDAASQARRLRDLNATGQHEAVIQLFEGGRLPFPEAALSEYVTALARTGRLDNTALLQTLQRGFSASVGSGAGFTTAGSTTMFPRAAAAAAAPPPAAPSFPQQLFGAGGAAPGAMAGAALAGPGSNTLGALGSAANPVYMLQAEPGFWSQIWRTVRMLGLAFLLMAGVGAVMDDKGLGRGILNNPDLKPSMETTTRFGDVKGVDEAKGELEEIVEYLKDPERFTALGGKLPKGVLLVGPPGTGKTMLARAIAGEAGVPFFYTSGSEFEEMFVGVGARRVRDLFAAAKKAAPCIVFIDEIDAIGGKRSPKDQQYMKMTLNQLLVELDGFKPSEGVIVVAATNFPQSLDKALVRPGRFDRHVTVPNPDIRGRQQILEVHARKVPMGSDVDLEVISRDTPGFSGADLANLINVAALKAAKDGQSSVRMGDLEFARDRILMGAERKSAQISEKVRRLTAYHEGGHALVALYTPGAAAVHKATVVPRGPALGMVSQLPDVDSEVSVTRKQLLARLDVSMGGRCAEELIFGENDVTTGASSDLAAATKLARAMVTDYGFSAKIGAVSIPFSEASEESQATIEAEVRALVTAAQERAQKLLKEHEKELHLLAAALLREETLSGQQIKDLIALKGGDKSAAAA